MLNTAQKLNSVCFEHRGAVVSPDKNKLYQSGNNYYIELEIQECEMSVAWVKDFYHLTDLGYSYKVKEDSDGKKERKYMIASAGEMEKCDYPYLLPGTTNDFFRSRSFMDRELLRDQDSLEKSGARPSEWPDVWKEIPAEDKETLYIVDKKRTWYWPALIPLNVVLALGVDLPSGIVFILWDSIFDKDEVNNAKTASQGSEE